MLVDEPWVYKITDADQQIFNRLVRDDHPLRLALQRIPWEDFRSTLEAYYSPNMGQPAIDPVRMLKLEYLRYHCNLSDRQVIDRCTTDVSFRYFLQVGMVFNLPDASLLTRFRGRLKAEGFQRIFQKLVGIAREQGLVKDRLRLKDASHVIANIAVPTTLKLVAQARDQLLAAATPWDREAAEGQRINIELIRERTDGLPAAERLEARVTHLQEMLEWAEKIEAPSCLKDGCLKDGCLEDGCLEDGCLEDGCLEDGCLEDGDSTTNKAWQQLLDACEVTRKILFDQDNPKAGHRTLSVVDPQARRGKHGDWYDGYVIDIMMDADSELITEVNTLEAGGDEAQDAVALVRREQETHGNEIDSLSMDGAGFNGEMLRELEGAASADDKSTDDKSGLGVTMYVPPKKEVESNRFKPADFTSSADRSQVTCPQGEQSRYRQRSSDDRAFMYRFARDQCDDCPLASQCVARPGQGAFGRTVQKSDYEAEYARARARSKTEAYASVRGEHPAVERKLNEVMNHHDGRHARYWGLAKVHAQECMTCFTVNVKRLVKLLSSESGLAGARVSVDSP